MKKVSAEAMVVGSLVGCVVCIFVLAVVAGIEASRIDRLQDRVSCLEHPHGESSITATKSNGKWVVTKPHRTGC